MWEVKNIFFKLLKGYEKFKEKERKLMKEFLKLYEK